MFIVLCVTLLSCYSQGLVFVIMGGKRVQMAGRRHFFGQVIFCSVPQSSVSLYCGYGFDALRHV